MSKSLSFISGGIFLCWAFLSEAQLIQKNGLYIDVHIVQPGSITVTDVASAHAKDLAIGEKYGVRFLRYWVNEKAGTVYCLSSAPDSASIAESHNEAHGMIPQQVYAVTQGVEATPLAGLPFFLDIHTLGEGNATVAGVANAHRKDLAIQKKYGVYFINYWVCEEKGIVFCLSQTKSKNNLINTHKNAHGLIPAVIIPVTPGR